MAVEKRFRGKVIGPRDKNWSKGTWYIRKTIDGKRIHKAIPLAQTKEQAERAERAEIERLFNKKYGVGASTDFVGFSLGTYTRYCEQHNTNIGAKVLYVRLLNEHFRGRLLQDISPQDCRDAQARFKRSHSPSSVNRIMSTLSKMLTVAFEEGLIDDNPMRRVKMLKEPPPRNRLLTREEKERLWIQLNEDILLFRLVTLALNLPVRRGQLFALTVDAIDWQRGSLSVIASKGRGVREVTLNSTATHTLRLMLQDGQIPFPLKDIRKRWGRVTQAAGINKKGGKRGENFTFHDLRHELASELARRGAHQNTIQAAFGHSDMKITSVYINPQFEEMAQAMRLLDEEVTEIAPTQ